MNEEEIQKIYKYFELSNELKKINEEVKNIIERHSDINMDYEAWLSDIVVLEKFYDEKRGKYYLYDGDNKAYPQNNYFLWQVSYYEDSYYGVIYYPLHDNEYLKIESAG